MPDDALPDASLHPTEFRGRFAVHVGDAYAGTLRRWGTVHTSGAAAVEALLRSWLQRREAD